MGIDGKALITEDGWFMEKNDMWRGQAMSLKVKNILYHAKSEFQDILIFESETYKKVLVLDGVIQVTERDEFSYHEMMAHLPIFCHPSPSNVLVIGGGDGGVIRELLKHEQIKSITLCEIDRSVIEVTQKYIPSISNGSLNNKKVSIVMQDGMKFLEDHHDEFDIIITDSSDPVGPAKVLFEVDFYTKLERSLRSNGIIVSQGECIWLHGDLIGPLLNSCRNIFPSVGYAYTTIPTYPSGQIGFIICSKSNDVMFDNPLRMKECESLSKSLKYYNADVHRAAFVLPEFARRMVQGKSDEDAGNYK